MEDTGDWLTEEQLIAETGVGRYTLDRWRRAGLVPWKRQFLDFGVGTRTVYPPIAVPMIRRLQELQQTLKGVDRWRWALWLEGYPVDIIKWHDRLLRLKNRAEALAKGNIKPASIHTPGSPAAKAFSKATGAPQTPDPSLEIEKMSFTRLHKIIRSASVSDIELARRDCIRLAGLVTLATSLNWRRVRDAVGLTHQGRPATPIAPFERLIRLWGNLDFRACVIPFLMFVRSRPGYRYELDERFATLEIELRALSEKVASSKPSS